MKYSLVIALALVLLLAFGVQAGEPVIDADPSPDNATHFKMEIGNQTIVRETVNATLIEPIADMPVGVFANCTAYYGKPAYKMTTPNATYEGEMVWSGPSDPFDWEKPGELQSPTNIGLSNE